MVSEHKIKLLCTGNKFSQSAQMFRTVRKNEEFVLRMKSYQVFYRCANFYKNLSISGKQIPFQ